MTQYKSPATRRFRIRLSVLIVIYFLTMLFASMAFKKHMVSGIFEYAVAVLPGLPIIGIVWASMRLLVEEPDEFIRMLHVRKLLIATGFCLTIMTVWEFLQTFDLIETGTNEIGAAFIWFLGLGVGGLYNWLTNSRTGQQS